MHRFTQLVVVAGIVFWIPRFAAAQVEQDAWDEGTPQLRAPEIEPLDMEPPRVELPEVAPPEVSAAPVEPLDSADEETTSLFDEAVQSPEQVAPPADPTRPWTAPETVLSLHGYFRVRGEMWNSHALGRDVSDPSEDDLPFSAFVPIDSRARPAGGCSGSDVDSACGGNGRIRFANMRLRLAPTLSLSDDVHVHMMFDVLDNVVLGSTPDSEVWVADPGGGFSRSTSTTGVPVDSYATTINPPQAYRNSLQDSIVARRAWGQVRNRDLGELRFGRMASHWGLGIFQNAGEGIDADYSTDMDRVMGITNLGGFYIGAAWDFASEGLINWSQSTANREDGLLIADSREGAWDATNEDDLRQYTFFVARRMDEDEQKDRLRGGGWVLNGGLYFMMRRQFLSSIGVSDPLSDRDTSQDLLTRRKAKAFVPDLWAQFLWGGLRLELEAALVSGTLQNSETNNFDDDDYRILQFGLAFEAEYRLLDDKLGIALHTGYATGDADVDGLSSREDTVTQQNADTRLTTFAFHPAYQIDMILWRRIMGRFAGAYYLKPSISYDILRNVHGRLLGFRTALIYSRAAQEVQTYGSDPHLGIELNAALYYRSESGPSFYDGFVAEFQYGVLFPGPGLGYPSTSNVEDQSLSNAQALRLILGIEF